MIIEHTDSFLSSRTIFERVYPHVKVDKAVSECWNSFNGVEATENTGYQLQPEKYS